MSATSFDWSTAAGRRQPIMTRAASRPNTSLTTGVVIGFSGSNSSFGSSGLGCMPPKYLSIVAIISSGLKSPETQTAMLLGT
jgi:hypothetical protein